MLTLKCDNPFLNEFAILFYIVTLKLGHKIFHFSHRFKTWILKCLFGFVYFHVFPNSCKRWEIGIFEKPRLHSQILPNSPKRLKIEVFVLLPSYFVNK